IIEIKNPIITVDTALITWKEKALNIISRIYRSGNEKQERRYLKFKNDLENITYTNERGNTAGTENNIPLYNKQISNFIDGVISDIHDSKASKKISENGENGIDFTVDQTTHINIITEALRHELTGKQLFEIREIITKNEKESLKKVKLIEKFKFFGEDAAINIISVILTNPTTVDR
ncbi:MAG: hypothetical protein JKZ03_07815, partial [Flavobacteriaceae bacterium]|nr:hypothetical protein [Flavobacteriaceae bacterium]